MPKTFEEQYRDKLNEELLEAKEQMEVYRERYGQLLMDEQRLNGMKSQLEFEQQQQEGRIQQVKEMLNPALKKKKPVAPKLPEIPKEPETPKEPVIEEPKKPKGK